jgi:hypothetical protein
MAIGSWHFISMMQRDNSSWRDLNARGAQTQLTLTSDAASRRSLKDHSPCIGIDG